MRCGTGNRRGRTPVVVAVLAAGIVGCGPDRPADDRMAAAVATRVVSLSPAFTELLFAIGAGDVVVGRTDWCDFPPAARSVPSVGDGIAPNVEAILARRPDAVLVYASGANTAATAQLRAANIAVITLPMDVLDDVPAAARRLGQLTGRPTRADSLARTFAAALDSARAVAADGPVPRVMLLAWDQPPIVIGAGSFQHELVTLAGATNVFEDLPQPSGQVAIETIAARDPDAVLLLDAEAVPTWAARPEWRVVRAVREGLFLPVQGSEFARPSFRALDAVRMLRAAFATLPR